MFVVYVFLYIHLSGHTHVRMYVRSSVIELSKWCWASRFFVSGGLKEEVGGRKSFRHGVEKEVGVEFCYQL